MACVFLPFPQGKGFSVVSAILHDRHLPTGESVKHAAFVLMDMYAGCVTRSFTALAALRTLICPNK